MTRELLSSLITLYKASTHFRDLKEAIQEITFPEDLMTMTQEHTDAISDLVQANMMGYLLEAGNLLAANYAFDPFTNVNIPNAMCASHYVTFSVSIMFSCTDKIGSEVGQVLMFSIERTALEMRLVCV